VGIPVCCPIQFPARPLGDFCVTEVVDNNGVPARNLEAAQYFDVKGEIRINAGHAITGTATVSVYADQLGGDIDQEIGRTAPAINITGDGTFQWTVRVPGGTLPDVAPPLPPPAGRSNLYRLAAALTMVNSVGGGTETASFVDLGTFMIS